MQKTISPLKRLNNTLALDKHEISSIYFYSILSGLIQLSVPIGVQSIVGFVMGASMVTSIYVLVFLVVFGVFIVGILQVNQMRIIEKIQQKIFARNAFDFADKIPQFDLNKTEKYYLPEKVNRFFDTVNLQKGISKLLLDIPTASVQIVFGLLLLALYHPIFIIFDFLLILILWMILKLTSEKGYATSIQKSNYKYEVAAWLQDMARVVRSLKFSYGSSFNLAKTDDKVNSYINARTSHFKVLLLQYKTLVAFKVLITAAMLVVGTYLLIEQQINIGEFIAAEIVILTLIGATEKMISSIDTVYDVLTGLEKIASVTELQTDKGGKLNFDLSTSGLEVTFDNVLYTFGSSEKSKLNFSATIQPNSFVNVSGAEGSGKSIFLRLLGGIQHNYSGNILFNNISISNYDLQSLRTNIGFFHHSPDIFTGTISENIIMGREGITNNDIIALARELNIQHIVNNFANGLDTLLDPAGKKLPTSFVNQILMLRALINKPKLILLDEPFSALDSKTTDTLIDYILRNKNNATVFAVTNNEKFVEKCNYTILLNQDSISIEKK